VKTGEYMMSLIRNRSMRKKRIQDQAKNSKWSNPLDEKEIRRVFENENKSSEKRLSRIVNLKNAVKLFCIETASFEKERGLETIIASAHP